MQTTKPGHVVDGRYVVETKLGQGGMATVWRARDLVEDRVVAVKLLHPHLRTSDDAIARLHREATLLSRLAHPGIVRAHTLALDRAQPYFVMALVEGTALDDELGRRSVVDAHFDEPLLRRVFTELTDALTHAHRAGIVHRDLKPSNVMLTAEGVRILDFGVARIDASDHEATTQGRVIGTRYYMSPEQIDGAPADPRADVFALGLILFEVLTLRRAWVRDVDGSPLRAFAGPIPAIADNGPAQVVDRMRAPERPRPTAARADLDPIWDEIIARATALSRAERYASAEELAADVGPALALGLPEPAPRAPSDVAIAVAPTLARPPRAAPTADGRPPAEVTIDSVPRIAEVSGDPVAPERAPSNTDAARPFPELPVSNAALRRPGRTIPAWSAPIVFAAGIAVGAAVFTRSTPVPLVERVPDEAAGVRAEAPVVATVAGATSEAIDREPAVTDARVAVDSDDQTRPDVARGGRASVTGGDRTRPAAARGGGRSRSAPAAPSPFDAIRAQLDTARHTRRGYQEVQDAITRASSSVAEPSVRARIARLATVAALDGDADGLERALELLERAVTKTP